LMAQKILEPFELGEEKYTLPVLGFGVYRSPPSKVETSVREALKAGYRHIDTAQLYKNEIGVGNAVRCFIQESKSEFPVERKDIFITTKIMHIPDGADIKKLIRKSVSDIGLKYVDLFLIHTPRIGPKDRADVWRALEEVKTEGLIRSIGVSNFGVKHLEELALVSSTKPAVNQIELHPWVQQRLIVEYCQKHDIVVQAYCPLVRGRKMDDPTLQRVSKEVGRDPGQVLLRWSLQKRYLPLPKSDTPSRIRSNIGIYDFELTETQMNILDGLEGKGKAIIPNATNCK